MKNLLILALMVVSTVAEPPVDSRYLPPQQGGFSPSQSYGAPAGQPQRQTDAVFRSRPASSYGAPLNSRPSSQYIPPSPPSSQYGPPARPGATYGAPRFGSQDRQSARVPSTQYGAPDGAPDGAPPQQYGAPGLSAPSRQYGAPGFGGGQGQGQFSGSDLGGQSRAYLPPGQGRGYAGDDDGFNGEPANYNFEYAVKDEPSGNDFGHRESRQGDRAEGLYYVLLPDGRKQTVQYEADQNGYRPKISYEDVGVAGGRGQGYQNGGYQNGDGYQNGGPY
ncbi:pro-resilin [Amyelois transitella]|uniref:pro-resilin n=1 Tax=Amyelois transitella TaxID=680683 RepID=UPI00298F8E93|nr:pro-resilin [Amyelois transitella]